MAALVTALVLATTSHVGPAHLTVDDQQAVRVDSVQTAVEVIDYVVAAEHWKAERAVVQTRPRAQSGGSSSPSQSSSSGSGSGCAYSAQIHQAFGAAGDWATHIAMRESRCQPGASNPSGAHGIFQMLNHADIFASIPGCAGREFDASCNIQAAAKLYQSSGTAPWAL